MRPCSALRRAALRRGAFVAIALSLAACAAPTREPVVVFAASSLTEALSALEGPYEEAHPEHDLRLSFAGSQVLRLQLEQGARADVFASADPEHAEALADAGLLDAPVAFATSEIVAVVRDEREAPTQFVELAETERLVMGTAGSPVGHYARAALEHARATEGDGVVDAILARGVSEECNAALVRAKLLLGEADAALLYRADAQREGLRALPLPTQRDATFVIATTLDDSEAAEPRGGAFVAFVTGPEGRAVLERHGFEGAP